jgi:L-lactate dehydrogenase (cytochrome)
MSLSPLLLPFNPNSHLSGETNITLGTSPTSIIQMVSSNASLSPSAIIASATASQTLFFQLYKHAQDATAEKRVREVERLGYKAIWLTVDAIVPGNRERDVRSPWVLEEMEGKEEVQKDGDGDGDGDGEDGRNFFGTAGALIANDDRDMTWEKVSADLWSLAL